MVESYTACIEQAVKACDASLLLMGGGTRDRCIAARLAVRLGASVLSDVGKLSVTDSGTVEGCRNVYGGMAEAHVRSCRPITIVITSPATFEECLPSQTGAIVELNAQPEHGGIKLISVSSRQEEKVNIAVAKRIVSVGRGLGSEDKLSEAEALAKKLNAELGCTRPIAEEEHWMSRGRYIGVSGVTVHPDVYFACGISGQVQHMAGVGESKLIVAINKDAKAPIFQNCDYGIVGDLHKILPTLTELL